MQPLHGDQSDFEGENLGVHFRDASGSLDEDESGENDAQGTVVTGVVGAAVDDLVGCDDEDAGE